MHWVSALGSAGALTDLSPAELVLGTRLRLLGGMSQNGAASPCWLGKGEVLKASLLNLQGALSMKSFSEDLSLLLMLLIPPSPSKPVCYTPAHVSAGVLNPALTC